MSTWGVDKGVATGSDHELIVFTWEDRDKRLENGQCREGAASEDTEVTGWDIKGLVDDKEALEKAERSRREMTASRPDRSVHIGRSGRGGVVGPGNTHYSSHNQHAKEFSYANLKKRWKISSDPT